MAALDTNVLVRFLTTDKDSKAQSATARKLLTNVIESGERLFVPVTVMLELEWVLRSAYRFEKTPVIAALETLMETMELDFESENALSQAIVDYDESNADFADCLHVALAAQADDSPLWTFDVAASTLSGAQAL